MVTRKVYCITYFFIAASRTSGWITLYRRKRRLSRTLLEQSLGGLRKHVLRVALVTEICIYTAAPVLSSPRHSLENHKNAEVTYNTQPQTHAIQEPERGRVGEISAMCEPLAALTVVERKALVYRGLGQGRRNPSPYFESPHARGQTVPGTDSLAHKKD